MGKSCNNHSGLFNADKITHASAQEEASSDFSWYSRDLAIFIFSAFLSPSSARAFIFWLLSEITAISVAAKKALSAISIICNKKKIDNNLSDKKNLVNDKFSMIIDNCKVFEE